MAMKGQVICGRYRKKSMQENYIFIVLLPHDTNAKPCLLPIQAKVNAFIADWKKDYAAEYLLRHLSVDKMVFLLNDTTAYRNDYLTV